MRKMSEKQQFSLQQFAHQFTFCNIDRMFINAYIYILNENCIKCHTVLPYFTFALCRSLSPHNSFAVFFLASKFKFLLHFSQSQNSFVMNTHIIYQSTFIVLVSLIVLLSIVWHIFVCYLSPFSNFLSLIKFAYKYLTCIILFVMKSQSWFRALFSLELCLLSLYSDFSLAIQKTKCSSIFRSLFKLKLIGFIRSTR